MLALAFLVYGPVLIELGKRVVLQRELLPRLPHSAGGVHFAWRRRGELAGMTPAPSAAGALLLLAGMATLLVGTAGIELFLTRVSMVAVVAGTIAFLYGWAHQRVVGFPDPRSASIQYHLGVAYAQSGDTNGAKRALTSALKLDPDFEAARIRSAYSQRSGVDSLLPEFRRMSAAGYAKYSADSRHQRIAD